MIRVIPALAIVVALAGLPVAAQDGSDAGPPAAGQATGAANAPRTGGGATEGEPPAAPGTAPPPAAERQQPPRAASPPPTAQPAEPRTAAAEQAEADAAPQRLRVMLDWFINPDHAPIILAKERGLFEAEGLSVEIIPPADAADPPKMAAAGKVDLAVGYQPQLHLQVAEGLPLKRVGTLVATPLNCLLVLEGGPIRSVADLKGRTVGYSVAGVEEALLGAILQRVGLTLDDVTLVNVNFSLSPALLSKQVDAVIGAYRNFELNQMEIEGRPGRCFYLEEEGLPPYDELIYVANPDTADLDAIARFLTATEEATQYIVNHPDEAWLQFSATSPELQDELNEKAWTDTWPRFALRPQAFSAGRYRKFEEFLVETGLLETAKPVEELAIDVTR